ncbi:MAG: tetratricopeptide repeat protein [Bryobacteraceae bacterium]
MAVSPFKRLAFLLALAPSLQADFTAIRELLRRGQFPEVLRQADSELKLHPNDFQIWTLKGIALQSLGQRAEGLAALRKALTLQPRFLPALQALAQIEYEGGDPGARQTLQRIVALQSDPAAHAMLGVLAFEAKDCANSVDHFAKAGAAATANPVARWQFATCLFGQGLHTEAERHFEALLGIKEDRGLRFNLGLARFHGKRFAEAVSALEPLALQDLPDADALSLLASAYEANGQTPRAVEVLRRAIELHPRDEGLYADLAGICLEHHSPALGIEVMEVGAKNNPESARIQTILGVLHDRSGHAENAAAAYSRAIALAPDAGFGAVAQAMTLLRMGAAEEAVKLLRAQRLRGGGAKVDAALAQALLQQPLTEASAREAETSSADQSCS